MNKLLFFLSFMCSYAFGQSGLDSLRMVLPKGHNTGIKTALFSPDSKYVLTAALDNTPRLYDLASGKEILTIEGHMSYIVSIAFSPDCKYILTASSDSTARLFDVKTGSEVFIYDKLKTSLDGAGFSNDGKMILIHGDNKAVVYEIFSNKIMHVLKGHKAKINTAVFSENDKLIVTSCDDGTVRVFNVESGENLKTFKGKSEWIISVCISKNNELLLTNNSDSTVSLYNLISAEEQFVWGGLTQNPTAVFSPDGKYALISSWDSTASIFDVKTGAKIQSFKGHFQPLVSAEFSPDGKTVLTSSMDLTSTIWDVASARELKTFVGHTDFITKSIFSPDGRFVLSYGSDNTAIIWDVISGKAKSILTGYTENPEYLEYSQDGKYILTVNQNKKLPFRYLKNRKEFIKYFRDCGLNCLNDPHSVRVWDVLNGTELKLDIGHREAISSAHFSPDGNSIFIQNPYGTGEIWDLKKSAKKTSVSSHDYSHYSSDGSRLITITGEFETSKVEILDALNGNKQLTLLGHKDRIRSALFSPDDRYVLTASHDKTARIYDATNGKTKKILKGHEGIIMSAVFSPDGKSIMTISKDNTSRIWDFPSAKLKFTLKTELDLSSAKFENNGKIIVTYSTDFSETMTMIWDAETGKVIDTLLGISNLISSPNLEYYLLSEGIYGKTGIFKTNAGLLKIFDDVFLYSFCPNNKCILTTNNDHMITVTDLESMKTVYTKYLLMNNNWIVQLPNSPYYMCSKDASKMLHYVTPSLKVIGFEQLDPIYNRPDIVLDSIGRYFGNNDRGMIEEYRKAWEKRIERLGLKDQMDKLGKGEISVPNAEIENAESITYENSEGNVKLVVKANDPKYKLRRFNVWVNEVPLFGSNGISIAGLNKNEWDTTLSIPLGLGENKIQVSVMNELGLENLKYPLYVKYSSDKVVPKTHYIGLGVNKFDNGKNLSFCVKDVKDLSDYFSKLPNSSIKLLTENEVNKENIAALKEYLKTTSVHDRVIISCSSHGVLDSTKHFYLATHDTDFKNPKQNGISYELLSGLLDEIPARKKLLLLDACYSGENDAGTVKMENAYREGTKGATVIRDEQSKETDFKKMKELFINVSNNSGAYVISATSGMVEALEGNKVIVNGKPIENGSFTYAVLEFIKKNKKKPELFTVGQLKKYVEKRVVEITNGEQTPTSRQETMEIDWDLH